MALHGPQRTCMNVSSCLQSPARLGHTPQGGPLINIKTSTLRSP